MIRYLIAGYIIFVLALSGTAKKDLGKKFFQLERKDVPALNDLRLKRAEGKMLAVQIKETEVVQPPNLNNFGIEFKV